VISRDQYLDLVYSQTGTLYDLIPNAPHSSTNPTPTPSVASHAADGTSGTFHARLSLNKSVIPIPSLLLLMYKILLLRVLLPIKPLKLIQFNLHLPVKIKIKIKGRVRIKRKKIIINNVINPRLILLMTKKNTNLVILALSVVRIVIRKIVHDVLRLLSSCKAPGHLLHLPFFHNHFLLSSRPSWSFMTNLLPLPHIMSLCVLVTPRRTNL
jgi:hypothetical protein